MKPILHIREGALRPARPSDFRPVLELLHGESARRYLCDDKILPRETVEEMLERSSRLDADGLGLWVIEREPGGFAGIVGLEPVCAEVAASPQMASGIEPVIALAPCFEGVGLATDALAAMINHACQTLRLARLVAAVDEPNKRSHRLMQRAGFTVIGKAMGPAHPLVLYEKRLATAPNNVSAASIPVRSGPMVSGNHNDPTGTMPQIEIVPFRSHHADAVIDLTVDAWSPVFAETKEEVPGFVYDNFYPDGWDVRQKADVTALLEGEPGTIWLAMADGVLAGYVGIRFHPEDHMGEVCITAVAQRHRRQGVGRRLLEFAEQHIRAGGMKMIMVETVGDSGHAPARRAYEKFGFEPWPVARYFKRL